MYIFSLFVHCLLVHWRWGVACLTLNVLLWIKTNTFFKIWNKCFFFLFLGGGHAYGMWKFPGQGSNLSHSCDPSHSSDNARLLRHWATRELLNKSLLNLILSPVTLPVPRGDQHHEFLCVSVSRYINSYTWGHTYVYRQIHTHIINMYTENKTLNSKYGFEL